MDFFKLFALGPEFKLQYWGKQIPDFAREEEYIGWFIKL
jgi:hypothetical protein